MPILPPTCAGDAAFAQDVAGHAVVVVLPFEPVIPMIRPFQKRRGQFHFADHCHARAGAPLRSPRRSAGTPGESTIRSHAFEHFRRLWLERHVRAFQLCAAAAVRSSGSGRWRALRAPLAASSSTAPDPIFPCPHQDAASRSLTSFICVYLNFSVVSANSAITSPAIQNRAMIFDSCQPSASK